MIQIYKLFIGMCALYLTQLHIVKNNKTIKIATAIQNVALNQTLNI